MTRRTTLPTHRAGKGGGERSIAARRNLSGARARVVKALVPLSEMFGYIGDLRSKTSGRAVFSMTFDSYAEVPKAVADEIVQKAQGA